MTCLPLAAALLLQPGPLPQDPVEVHWYDLRPIVAAARPVQVQVELGSPFERFGPDHRYFLEFEEGVALGTDKVEDWILESIAVSSGGECGWSMLADGVLGLQANRLGHAIAADAVELFTAAHGPQVAVRLQYVPRGILPDDVGGALSPKEAADFFARIESLPRTERRIPLGALTRITSPARETYVGDVDAEVSHVQGVWDPSMFVWPEGLEATVGVNRLARGDRTVVRIKARRSGRVRPTRTVALEANGGIDLELPAGPYETADVSGILRNGGALVVRLGGVECDAIVLGVTPPPPPADSRILDLGHLLCSVEAQHGKIIDPLGGLHVRHHPLQDEPWTPAGAVERWVGSVLGPEASDRLHRSDRLRLVMGERSEALDALRRRAAEECTAVRGFDVELAFGDVTPSAVRALMASPSEAPAALPHRATLPALSGTTSSMVRGFVRTALVDHDMQIIEGASAVDPNVGSEVNGVVFACRPRTRSDGTLALRLDARWIEGFASLRTVTARAPAAFASEDAPDWSTSAPVVTLPSAGDLPIELMTRRSADVNELRVIALDRWTLWSATRIPGTDRTFAVAIRLREVL